MIKVNNLHKHYGNKEAVRGITFDVDSGEIFGFLGPNGAGKSTTIKVLTGQLAPSAGDVVVLGHRLPAERHLLADQMGVTPENANLYERLSVGENLNLFCRLYNVPTAKGSEWLERLGLLDSLKTPVKRLSKGMKQRVLLVRTLLHSPRLLVLDEPTSGLDPSSAASIHGILRELNQQGTTIFITTHNMEEADHLCHRVAFLCEGQIAELGRPEELRRKYGEERLIAKVLTDGEQVEHNLPLRGNATGEQVGRWLSDGKVVSIHSVESTLADIFIRVTGRKLA
ncbi:MAG: ATP-binding cassette domain-containing protein [Bacillota bacterium]|jgi:ABC-2 type transport system ATP-binding protein